jgi:hypothetical protein
MCRTASVKLTGPLERVLRVFLSSAPQALPAPPEATGIAR